MAIAYGLRELQVSAREGVGLVESDPYTSRFKNSEEDDPTIMR